MHNPSPPREAETEKTALGVLIVVVDRAIRAPRWR
jgi:hypothetical protein